MGFLLQKLQRGDIWEKIFRERFSEPLHLNLMSLPVAAFGSLRAKVYFDLIVRQQHAYGLLTAADTARHYGLDRITVVEFGVANGGGLLNICKIAEMVTRETGVAFDIAGFDSGSGMPRVLDYRDHPEFYQPGWYKMQSQDALRRALPPHARLVIGEIDETVPEFVAGLSAKSPVAFASIDVDYYSSTVSCLKLFDGAPELYLPTVELYLDDVGNDGHNPWAGELLAVAEFNEAHPLRKIGPSNFLREKRLFKNASWISHMHRLHVFDHPGRHSVLKDYGEVHLGNPYLSIDVQDPGRAAEAPREAAAD